MHAHFRKGPVGLNVSGRSTRAGKVLFWLLPLLVAAIGLAMQQPTALNHDVAWVLDSSRRLLHGGEFGVDVVDSNPPLIWWISSIPMFVAEGLGVAPIPLFRVFVALLALCSMFMTERLLRPRFPAVARGWIMLTLAFVLFIGVHRDYGQREHLTVMLVLPYLVVVTRRIHGDRIVSGLSVLAGIAAAIGICFKPHLLAVPFAVESVLLWQTRSWRTLIRPETLAAVGFGILYVGLVVMTSPAYLSEVAPRISRIYWAFSFPFLAVARSQILLVELLLACLFLLARSGWPKEATVMAVAGIGFMIAGFAQAKGYSYHFYGAYACSLVSVALIWIQAPKHRRVVTLVLVLAVAWSGWRSLANLEYRGPGGTYGQSVARLSDFVRQRVPEGGSYLAIGTHPYPGFPTALYADREWAGEGNAVVFLPAVVRIREGWGREEEGLLEFAEEEAWATVRRDMAKSPDLVLIDTARRRHAIVESDFDFLEFFLEDPWFRTEWARYEEIHDAPPGLRAFVRGSAGEL
jgi:hypothetical protein